MNKLKRYILIPIVLIVFYLAFYFLYTDAKNNTIREFNNEQLLLAQTASKGISSLLEKYKSDLLFLSKHHDFIHNTNNSKESMKFFYESHQNVLNAITRVDSNGVILYTYPYDSSAIGKDISYQKHIQEIMTTHEPVISDVFMSVQGYFTLVYHVPVFNEDKFVGSLGALIPIDKLGHLFLDDIGLNKKGHSWLITENNTEIYCRIPNHEGNSFLENTNFNEKNEKLLKKIEFNNTGSGRCIHQGINQQKDNLDELYMVYHRFPIGSTQWTILISYEESEVYQQLSNFRKNLALVLIIFLVSLSYYLYSLLKVRNIIKEEKKRKEAEKLVKDNLVQLRTIINTIPDYIWLKDEKGVYLLCNNKFEEFFGAKEHEIVGKTDHDFVDKELADFFREKDKAAMYADKPTKNEEQVTRAVDGIKIDLETIKTPLYNSNNQLVGILGVARDFTLRNKQEVELKSAKERAEENDRLKSAFLANISHEIRTPMNGIMGFTQLLGDDEYTAEEKKSYIKIIEKSGHRMLNTLNDIINISKIESGQVDVFHQKIDLIDFMDYHYQFFKPECKTKGLDLIFSTTDEKKELFMISDHEKLSAIIINLIKNAIKYTESGFVEMKYNITNDQFLFTVTDSGIGIPKEKINHIFDRFIQVENAQKTNKDGIGLGLAIVKAYIDMLHGEITVNSNLNKGSIFKVSLPINFNYN